MMIELTHIRKQYMLGENYIAALNDVNLSVAEHEFISIIGPSGSGKSTLMNIIGCLDYPDSGSYFFDGKDIAGLSENELSDIRSLRIGFVFQQFNLLAGMSALENVELPLIYQRVKASERRKRAEQALEMVGLAERLHHKPLELSGGQQQRVAIARALISRPSLILADEPTGNLDSHSGEEVMKIIETLHDEGNTILLITHNPSLAARAQRVVHVSDGLITDGVFEKEGIVC